MAETPADSPLTLDDVMSSPRYRALMAPEVAVGDEAPDFELPLLERPHERVRLSSLRGRRPVALIFGSYT